LIGVSNTQFNKKSGSRGALLAGVGSAHGFEVDAHGFEVV